MRPSPARHARSDPVRLPSKPHLTSKADAIISLRKSRSRNADDVNRAPGGTSGGVRAHALQKLLHGADRAGVGRDITGQARNPLLELAALHDVDDAPHRL